MLREMESFPSGLSSSAFFDDFLKEYELGSGATANLPVSTGGPWIGASLNGGTATFSQSADASYGIAVLSTGTTGSDDGVEIVTDYEFANLVTGKKTNWMARWKAGSTSTGLWFLGGSKGTTTLSATQTIAAAQANTDAWGFMFLGGYMYGFVRRDSVQLVTLAYALDYTAYHVYGIQFDMSSVAGTGNMVMYLDGVQIGYIPSTTMPYETEETFNLAIAGVNTTAAANTSSLDYVGCSVAR